MTTLITIIILSVISGILYRLGGASESDAESEFPWIPRWFRRLPKKRDVGCGIACYVGYQLLALGAGVPWYVHLICGGLLWGALSTYWDEAPWNNGTDSHWQHGLACGIAYLPYCYFVGDWSLYIVRAVVIALLMGTISALSGNDVVEEMGRGASLVASLPILLIG